jgi:hypothetical protein
MNANPSAAYGVFPDTVSLNEVVQTLSRGGVEKESICLMLSPAHPITTIVSEFSTRPFEREANAITAGLIGWLSEFGAVVIPRFGFFVRSREFFHSLALERDSTVVCDRSRTLASLGFPQKEAKHFDQACEGGVLLYVSCPQTAQTHWAAELLRASGAEEVGLLANEPTVENAA